MIATNHETKNKKDEVFLSAIAMRLLILSFCCSCNINKSVLELLHTRNIWPFENPATALSLLKTTSLWSGDMQLQHSGISF